MTTAGRPEAVAALTEVLADAMMFGLGYHAEQVAGYRLPMPDYSAAAQEFIEAYLPARALLARLAEAEAKVARVEALLTDVDARYAAVEGTATEAVVAGYPRLLDVAELHAALSGDAR